jgi:hypothetical protein
MIPIIEDAILGTDLNGDFHDLLNVKALVPVPVNLASSDHSGLSDSRPPLPGSVTNDSVAASAAIVQSKLSLDGVIPTAWLGTSSTTAARGDLAEYVSSKNQPGGYAGLDGTGKVAPAFLPASAGTGTVTSVGLTMPAQFSVTGSPVTGAGTLAVSWAAVADLSWFGNKSGGLAAPQFYTTPLPTSLIPDLDTSIVTSGVFSAARLPVAVGLGSSHAPGAVPDPGDGSGGALATDYLARDMSYKAAPSIGPTYQPTLPNPVIVPTGVVNPVPVTISCAVSDAVIFYSITSAVTGFIEFPGAGYVHVTSPGNIWAYAAHPGYNNSSVVTLAI